MTYQNTMHNATLSTQGRVTIPKNIRKSLGLKAQDKLNFTLTANGTVIIQALKRLVGDEKTCA